MHNCNAFILFHRLYFQPSPIYQLTCLQNNRTWIIVILSNYNFIVCNSLFLYLPIPSFINSHPGFHVLLISVVDERFNDTELNRKGRFSAIHLSSCLKLTSKYLIRHSPKFVKTATWSVSNFASFFLSIIVFTLTWYDVLDKFDLNPTPSHFYFFIFDCTCITYGLLNVPFICARPVLCFTFVNRISWVIFCK